MEKKHKEDYDNNVVVDTDKELESSPENEIATPDLEEAKKRKKRAERVLQRREGAMLMLKKNKGFIRNRFV